MLLRNILYLIEIFLSILLTGQFYDTYLKYETTIAITIHPSTSSLLFKFSPIQRSVNHQSLEVKPQLAKYL